MIIKVRNKCPDYKSFRAQKVKSLFNAEDGCSFNLDAEVDLDGEWGIGIVVGASGTGKTSIGKQLFGGGKIYEPSGWDEKRPIIECIDEGGDFDGVTQALSSVGLGSVPSWLRPYHVLSNGEKFRADLAKVICESPKEVIIDEFTSVVDRQIAKFGALAFQKAWRRTGGKCVLLSCHYDILDWVQPDWVFDTVTAKFTRGSLWQRPKFQLDIVKTDSTYWRLFEKHYYLKLPKMIGAEYWVGMVDGEPVSHIAVAPMFHVGGAVRASRMVVMPEWQGAGIGFRFLEGVLDHYLDGGSKWGGRVQSALFHTSHPALCAGLRRSKKWRQTSAMLYGGNKKSSLKPIPKAHGKKTGLISGYGGHFRAVQGFRYWGERGLL